MGGGKMGLRPFQSIILQLLRRTEKNYEKKNLVSAKFRTGWIPAKYISHAIKLSC